MKSRLDAMSAAERSRADAEVCRSLARLAEEHGARAVLAYLSLADEIRVDGFLAEMVQQGREILLPRVVGNGGLRYGLWWPTAKVSRDAMGVLAPDSVTSPDWSRGPVLAVVPGRAFDVAGGRVGRGGGYYDRMLAACPERCLVAGVAYECQVVNDVPREAHDRDVACLVTETGCRKFRAEESR